MKNLWISTAIAILIAGCTKDDKTHLAAVSTLPASNITSNSAQTGGMIAGTGGTSLSKSGICWATHNNPSVGDSIISSDVVSGAFTTSLSNLNANTAYYVKAFAINGVGTAYGNTDSFLTAKGVPTVTTAVISNIAPLSAHSGGIVTNDGGTAVTARGICWSTLAHPTLSNLNKPDSKTTDGPGTGSFVDSLVNLASQTVYYVRAYATNSYGTAYGNEISFVSSSANVITDIDGNVYPVVMIGNQTWMGSNLKTTRYQNGDPIINSLTSTSFNWWTNFITGVNLGAYTFPNGDSSNGALYGKYYNNGAINDAREICPIGWHVPTDGEWQTLEFHEGMPAADTGNNVLRGAISSSLLVGGSSGLNLQLAGYLYLRGQNNVTYEDFNVSPGKGLYWSSTEFNLGGVVPSDYCRIFFGNSTDIQRQQGVQWVMSVRCIKN